MFRDKSINFSLVPPLLRTLAITDTKSSPPPSSAGFRNNGSWLYYFASFKIRTITLSVLGDKAGQEPNYNL